MKIKIGNKTFEVSKNEEGGYPDEAVIEFDGILRTEEEETSFIENHKKDARKEGLEIAVKQYREEFDFEGRTLDKLIEGVKAKTLTDASIEPTEQLKKANDILAEKEIALQNALTSASEKDKDFTRYKNQSKLNKEMARNLPKNLANSNEDMLLILNNKRKYDFDENGNGLVLDNAGNVIKDSTTANPISIKDDMDTFFKDNQNYIKPNSGGSGGVDSTNKGDKKSMDDFIEEQRTKGNSPNSEGFNNALKPLVESNLIDMD